MQQARRLFMRAIVIKRYGGPEVLAIEERPIRSRGPVTS
jgi:hypothetical protein